MIIHYICTIRTNETRSTTKDEHILHHLLTESIEMEYGWVSNQQHISMTLVVDGSPATTSPSKTSLEVIH